MNFVYIIRKKVLINLRIAFSNNCVQVGWGVEDKRFSELMKSQFKTPKKEKPLKIIVDRRVCGIQFV